MIYRKPSRFSAPILTLIIYLTIFSPRCLAGIDDDLASPVTTPARTALIVGSVATLTLLLTEDTTVDSAQQEAVEDKPLGKFAKVGDYGGRVIPNGAYVLGMLVAGAAGQKGAYSHAEVMTLATIYAASVSTLLKVTVREPRPNDGNDRKSFPSGHATTAFAFASVVGAEHSFGYGALAYGLAGLVAYSRMTDNKHNLHDVVAGATIGMAYGLGIHYRHGKNRGRVSWAPLVQDGAYGLMARVSF